VNRFDFKQILQVLTSEFLVYLLITVRSVWHCVCNCVSSNFDFFFAKIECGLYFLDRFDVLMSKIIFKK
jgi:hypothetical protein